MPPARSREMPTVAGPATATDDDGCTGALSLIHRLSVLVALVRNAGFTQIELALDAAARLVLELANT